MPCCHVSYFVRHYAGEFRFRIGLQDEPGLDKEEAARQCKGIYRWILNHLDGEGNLRVRIADQVLADTINVFGDNRVVDHLRLPLDLLCKLLAERNLFFKGVEVDLAANVPVANRVRIFFLIIMGKSREWNGQEERKSKTYGGSKGGQTTHKTPLR